MKSENFESIVNRIKALINSKSGDSLLEKLEFDYSITNEQELANYLIILLVLIENSNFNPIGSNLLVKKVLTKPFSFLKDKESVYHIIQANKVFPYTGLADTTRRVISTIIYDKQEDSEYIKIFPKKEFLTEFNFLMLKEYLNVSYLNIIDATKLLYCCVANIDSESKIYLDRNATDFYKSFLRKNREAFLDYLHYFIRFKWYGGSRHFHEGKVVVPEPFYVQIFGSNEGFLDFLGEQLNTDRDNEDPIYQEIENFVRTYTTVREVTYDGLKLNIDIHHNLKAELEKQMRNML